MSMQSVTPRDMSIESSVASASQNHGVMMAIPPCQIESDTVYS